MNSKIGSVVIGGSGNTVGNSSTTTTVNVDYKFIGGASADVLNTPETTLAPTSMEDGDDDLTGYRSMIFSMAVLAMTSCEPAMDGTS